MARIFRIQVDIGSLTLRQLASLRGYDRQVDLLRALEQEGTHVQQSDMSQAFRGRSALWPRARKALRKVLLPRDHPLFSGLLDGHADELLVQIIGNAAED